VFFAGCSRRRWTPARKAPALCDRRAFVAQAIVGPSSSSGPTLKLFGDLNTRTSVFGWTFRAKLLTSRCRPLFIITFAPVSRGGWAPQREHSFFLHHHHLWMREMLPLAAPHPDHAKPPAARYAEMTPALQRLVAARERPADNTHNHIRVLRSTKAGSASSPHARNRTRDGAPTKPHGDSIEPEPFGRRPVGGEGTAREAHDDDGEAVAGGIGDLLG